MITFNYPIQQLQNLQICGMNGLFNPYMITGTRKDMNVMYIQVVSGTVKVFCQGVPAESSAELIGTKVYVNSGSVYDGTYTVETVNISSLTVFTFYDIPNLGDTVGGYVNLKVRANWYCEMQFITSRPTKVYTSKYREDLKGRISIDVSSIFKGLMQFKDEFAYDVVNEADLNLSRAFSVKQREVYTGSTNEFSRTFNFYLWLANGAKQLGAKYGSNYREFYPALTEISHKGKFLTLFEKPVHWVGYPFDLQFIYSGMESVTEGPFEIVQLKRRELERDINNLTQQTTDAALDNGLQHMGYINRLTLRGGYQADRESLLVSVRVDDAGSEDFGEDIYADDYWIVTSRPDPGEFNITEEKEVELRHGCITNPFYIKWLHSLAGWDYWMFDKVQFFERNVYDSDRYNPVVTNIETAQSREDFVGKKARPEVMVGAQGLTTQQIRGLEDLLSSPKVYRLDTDLYNSTEEIKWQVIKLKPGSFKTVQTNINRHDLEVEFELQDLFLQGSI